MQEFIPGQRWISDTELQMGLGTVLATDHRSVTIVFVATGETRIYAKQSAPLTRVKFNRGDTAISHEGWSIKVVSVAEHDGLLTYFGINEQGDDINLEEGQLDNFIQLSRPTDRLFNGQIDQNKWFELRYQTRQYANELAHSELQGLAGVRTSLIPHQLYIAKEVANRYAPRVLLADEVGLGKTIEAGLILHHQLLTERAKRVLIVVPESLVHQWLVEMIRRFNLRFSIFGEDRCQAEEEAGNQSNPFHTEQLVLCNLEFLVDSPDRLQQACEGNWDLLVVDEAHHLQWSEQDPSIEYKVVEQLATTTNGVLLLTATPEQLGKESHFARLRLLDPDRFPSFVAFTEEEESYQPVAQAMDELMANKVLSERAYQTLLNTIGEGDNKEFINILQSTKSDKQTKEHARARLIEHLLDRHGTGRVLFRNTRAAVKGFPDREINGYPLSLPDEYKDCLSAFQGTTLTDPQLLLCPELLFQSDDKTNTAHWTDIDPRVDWLASKINELRPNKVLVIAASAHTALDLAQSLRTKTGIHSAVFHEWLSIVERDKAAAYFADQERGTQVLVCSEIGSEGRNFQFSHHLILFDLPMNPDLLEQRIGRLDRIGQSQTVKIHVPYMENSAQAVVYRWYHEGLSAFEHTCPAGQSVLQKVKNEFVRLLTINNDKSTELDKLITDTKSIHAKLNDALHNGRDKLLEYNSCRPQQANSLKSLAEIADANSPLPEYMEAVFDCYGVDLEEHSKNCYIVRPSDHMQLGNFPELPQDGITVSYDRNTALTNEDMQFLTWEHPLVRGAMDLVLDNEAGNTAITTIEDQQISAGTILLECIYVLESASSETLQPNRYLPPTTIRILADQSGKDYSNNIKHNLIDSSKHVIDRETTGKIIRAHADTIRAIIEVCDRVSVNQAKIILKLAEKRIEETLLKEIHRLNALSLINPNVREDEIDFFVDQEKNLMNLLQSARPRLDAVRIIVST